MLVIFSNYPSKKVKGVNNTMQKPLPLLNPDQILEVECLLSKIVQAEKSNNRAKIQQLSQQLETIYQSVLADE